MATTTNIFNNEMFQNKGLRPYKPFGLNVHVPEAEATLAKISESVKSAASTNYGIIATYLANNDDVFSGKVGKEIKSLNHEQEMTSRILDNADLARPRKFEMHM